MKYKFVLSISWLFALSVVSCAQNQAVESKVASSQSSANMIDKIVKSETEWKELLTPEQYQVLRQQGTEYAFSGDYWNHKEKGVYTCAACDLELFSSQTKFKSGTGWPSFYEPVTEDHVGVESDKAFGMERTEVHCARCGGHLGHIFNDGPKPTGLRYCINSVSLNFKTK